jgi:ribonuclease D
VLLALASEPALDTASLENIEGLSERAAARYGQAILECIDAARTEGPTAIDAPVSLRPHAEILTRLKEIVRSEADKRKLSPELLASRRMLEALLTSVLTNGRDTPQEFRGWRFDVVTRALLDSISSPQR